MKKVDLDEKALEILEEVARRAAKKLEDSESNAIIFTLHDDSTPHDFIAIIGPVADSLYYEAVKAFNPDSLD